MRVILTHEQADFDAIASMLAAYLLDDSSIPVLPRRINRNVRAFITLYGIELPFIEADELPNEPIDHVTLVDTQSMVSLKGMKTSMQVQVIDHHPVKDNIPQDWLIKTPETGANTTYLVELLQEINGALTPIQATLLLLGIYEDTGSLIYSRTTPRDLRAAGYLLEVGANLQIASDFLNHPLSLSQQGLYDKLRAGAEILDIHGHTIIVTSSDASELDEELSSIAHKLRDLLDPDALFMAVRVRSGIQLIARSTSDNIDVSEVVNRFGGGGHERAAAALIRDKALDEVLEELKQALPEIVHPAISVAQIMSSGPQLLVSSTPVEIADERMRRYGYEGYPVVEKVGDHEISQVRVVGLLTRRQVDRALAHDLHPTVSQLMTAGEVTITPDESIETLQQLMINTGWGQIPVVDKDSGEIIGIVTRTDLLKTLTLQQPPIQRDQLIARLEAALPWERLNLLKTIAAEATKERSALYIVGGFVRDLLLEQPSLDFDLVVEGDAVQLTRALAKRWGGRVTSHSQFGTAKWHLENSHFADLGTEQSFESIDLVSARTEFYTYPTALPTVERGSIKLDLHRRDFTINTLALRLDGRHYGDLHDYWGGLNDLRQGIVRVLHSLSFVDDPTRILRAVRFEQRFNFHIDKRTLELLVEARSLIDKLSGDRIRHELNIIFSSRTAANALRRLDELSLLETIHPSLAWDEWLDMKIRFLPQSTPEQFWDLPDNSFRAVRRDLTYILLLVRLERENSHQITKRLKLPTLLYNQIMAACRLWRELPGMNSYKNSRLTTRLDEVPALSLYAVYLACDDEKTRALVERYARKWKYIHSTIDGHALKAAGLPPGPVYRKILGRLRDSWVDEEIGSVEEESQLLSQLIKDYQGSTRSE
jgi:tRNA nucleotidyltransferase (CCA-adding enzyme)